MKSENEKTPCCCNEYKEKPLEEYLIEFCAPTLAGIKCANLFCMQYDDTDELENAVADLNETCNKKGVFIELLRYMGNKAQLYVYRKTMLEEVLRQKEVVRFLQGYGYEIVADKEILIEDAINYLKHRMTESCDFPHEIGIFLGYPYGDVKGFIENSGKNYILCGHWKVYENAAQAREMFCNYDNCRSRYCNYYRKGISVSRLLVAV